MKRFCIRPDNEVALLSAGETIPDDSTVVRSEPELRKVADGWPATRLLAIWNGLAGVPPVTKFRDRAAVVTRIWKQLQMHQDPAGASEPVAAGEPAPVTKKEQVLALLRSSSGATLSQIMATTGWQKHSVRGFLSGAIHKKMGLKVVSFVNTDGERVYRLKR